MEDVAIDVDEELDSLKSSSSSSSTTTSDSTSRDQHTHVSRRDSIQLFREAADELQKESAAYLRQQEVKQGAGTTDLDRAAEGETFDLRAYFNDHNSQAISNGGKPKRMGVSVRNLTVVGQAPENSIIADNFTPIYAFLNLFNPRWWLAKTPTTDILTDTSMFCKDGEMVLVLGRPGAGCSTLLRVIANRRETFEQVIGDVNYGGISATEFERYRGEAIYTPEEDCHFPFLTLRETLEFSLRCKTPGNRLPDETQKHFREKMIKLLTTMFGLRKQLDTLVGNEFLRGLSGGERKRLTLMEAMVAAASINCWDCGTRGLDAASAFDYVQCLRIMTDVLGKTTICSFYQASEAIYNLFDRVCVLDRGRVIYFGPVQEAKQYFLDLGFKCEARKSTPDFLTGVTNPQERILRKGFKSAPETSHEFEEAWKKSKNCQRALQAQKDFEEEIEKAQPHIEFQEEVRAQKTRGVRKSGVYTAAYYTQVFACIVRQMILRWRDWFSLSTRYISVLIQAFVYSSLFFLMPFTDVGLYSRGGALFSALLYNALLSMSEMPAVFMGRLTLQKHKAYAMYRPSAFHLSQVITDVPFVLAQCVLFCVISYFMFGFQLNASKFFIYLFVLVLSSVTMTAFFRLLGNMSPSMFIAQQVQSIILILMIAYSGFIIPYEKMHPWFQWIFWINPLSYALQSIVINEVSGATFSCEESAVPNGEGYNMSIYRSCISTTGTSVPGRLYIIGDEYLSEDLNYNPSLMSLDIMVVFCFWVLFTVLNCLAVEFLEFTGGGYTKKVYKAGGAPKKASLEDEKEQARIVREATENMGSTLHLRQSTFSWKEVNYTVPVEKPEKRRQLLNNIDGWIKPGQMTALMGASGAGKTTLLDVLAKRKTIGKISGEIMLNGKPLKIDFERITGYVEQMDVFNPSLTVLEALQFSAKLRQEPDVPLQEKYDYVEKILEMMEMKHLGDALIGDLQTGEGISVEERKRLTIGMELVAKPHILFLDEPTSGLDAQSSYNIIKFIRKLADIGMPLVCTIHQPSSILFEYFDRILLLAKGGKTVYFGDIGKNSKTLTGYFERNGVRKCTKEENPAEYILEAIGAGVNGSTSVDWVDVWQKSPEFKAVRDELDHLADDFADKEMTEDEKHPREFATSQWYQFWEVYKRMNIIWWRSPFYNAGRVFNGLFLGVVLGFSYWNLGDSASDLRSRIFLLFQSMFVGILLVFAAIPTYYFQREFFRRDYASKFYSWIPFSISIVLVEIPYLVVITSITFLTMYWTARLDAQNPVESGFYLWLGMTVFTCYCVAFGQSVASVCTHIIQAITLLPIVTTFLFLFCGVLNPPSSMPYFWSSWLYPLVPTHYYLEGVVSSVLVGVQIECDPTDVTRFLAPPNMTCFQYAEEWLKNTTGYIINPNATNPELCGYCVYQDGADYYETFVGWDYDNRWRDMGIVACYWFFSVLVTTIFAYINRKGMR